MRTRFHYILAPYIFVVGVSPVVADYTDVPVLEELEVTGPGSLSECVDAFGPMAMTECKSYLSSINSFDAWNAEIQDAWSDHMGLISNPPDSTDPELQEGGGAGDCNSLTVAGNPVVIASRNKIQIETDFVSGGSFPLVLSKTYNLFAKRTGVFGYMWLSSFDYRLKKSTGQTPYIEILRPDGERQVFYYQNATLWHDKDIGELAKISYSDGKYTLTNMEGMQEIYDADGKILSRTNASGLTHNYNYDGTGKLQSVTHTGGQSLTLTWENDKLTEVSDGENNTYRYEYNTDGLLDKQIHPNADEKEFLYSTTANNRLIGIDINGKRYANFGYDTDGKVVSTSHGIPPSTVERYEFAENLHGSENTTTVTNPLGWETEYQYGFIDGRKLLATVSRLGGTYCSPSSKIYYPNLSSGLISRVVDLNTGIETDYTHDDLNRLAEKTFADGTPEAVTTTYTYHPTLKSMPIKIETPFRRTELEYDGERKLTKRKVTDLTTASNLQRITTIAYVEHPNGLIKTKTVNGPRTDISDVSTFHYDSAGRLTKSVNALGQETLYNSYDGNGGLLSVTAPNGLTTTYTYNIASQLTSVNVGGRTTTYTYNALGEIDRITLPDGAYTDKTFDDGYRVSSISDNTGATKHFTYDKMSNPLAEMTKQGGVPTYSASMSYDEVGKLRQVTGNNGQVSNITRYGNGAIKSVTDAKNNTTNYTYNSYDLLETVTDALNQTTSYEYNQQGLVTRVLDPNNNATTYSYDGFGQLVEQSSPDTGTTSFTYDSAGNIKTKEDANGNTLTYAYDALNRIKSVSDGTDTITYTYDQNGDKGFLTSISDTSGSTTYDYATGGELLSQTQVIQGQTYTTSYSYYSNGNLTTITYPSGNVVTYNYNNIGKISSIVSSTGGTVISGVNYKPFGPASGWTYGNGLSRSMSYDLDYRLTDIETAGKQDLHFEYDTVNNIDKIINLYANISTEDESFTFDNNGNRESETAGTVMDYHIHASSNRLTGITKGGQTHSFGYDNNGNRISENTFSGGNITYGYNAFNRLSSHTASGVTTTYKYNSLGQRVYKSNNTGTYRYVHSPNGQLLAEPNSSKEYIYFYGQPVGYINSGVLYYIHNDQLGRPGLITNSSDAIVWKASLLAFDRTAQSGSIGNFNLGFPGQYYDDEKDSWYNISRDYDAETGRYLQSDPIGLAGGLNTYAYVSGNPLGYIDRMGLLACRCASKTAGPEETFSKKFTSDEAIDYNARNEKAWGYMVGAGTLAGGYYIQMGKWAALTFGAGGVYLGTEAGPVKVREGWSVVSTTQNHGDHIASRWSIVDREGSLVVGGRINEKCE